MTECFREIWQVRPCIRAPLRRCPACWSCLRGAKSSCAAAGAAQIHKDQKLPLRTAAYVRALQSVTRAHIQRGFD
jgi:hypothetical protein